MAADGSLIFNTKIDESGFDKGTKNLSSKVVDLKNKIQSTEAEIKNLQAGLEKTGNTKVKPKIADDIKKDIKAAEAEVYRLSKVMDRIEGDASITATGLSGKGEFDIKLFDRILAKDAEYQQAEKAVEQYRATISRLKRELESVNNAAPLTKGTAEYQQKQQRVVELTGKLDVYKAKLNEAENAEKGENAQLKSSSNGLANVKAKLTQAISALKLLANGARRAGNAIKTAFSKTVGKAISNIRDHFKKANNSTNILEKSLRRIKNTLIRMFFFRLVHSPIDVIKDSLGEISKISPELNKNLSALKTESTYLKNSFAALAAPLVNLVTPALTSFMQTVSGVLSQTGQLVAVLTGQSGFTQAVKVQQDYAASLDDSTKSTEKNTKAIKENQKALAGFDELNVLDVSESEDSEGSAAAAPMFENVEAQVGGLGKRLVDLFRSQNFDGIGELVGEKINSALKKIKWDRIKTTVKGWASNIAGFFNGFIRKTDWNLVGTTIAEGLGTALLFAHTLVTKFDFSRLGSAFGNLINGILSPDNAALFADTESKFIVGIFAALTTAVKTVDWGKVGATIISLITHFRFADIANGAANLLNGFASALHKIDFKQIGEAFRAGLSKINWKNIWNGVTRLTTNALQGIADFFGLKGVSTSKLKTALQDIYEPISELYETLKKSFSELIVPIVNKFLPAAVKFCGSLMKSISPIVRSLTPILKKVIEVVSNITNYLAPAVETLGDTIGKIIDSVSPVIQSLLDLIGNIVKVLSPALSVIFEFVGKIADGLSPIFDFLGGIIDGVGDLFGMLVGSEQTTTISAELQEELDHLSNVSDDLNTIAENTRNTISSINESIQASGQDIQLIDDLQDRLETLMNKAELSDADIKEIKTIVDVLSDKLPGFETEWEKIIGTDEINKDTFVRNRGEMAQSIQGVIDKLKEQYATELIEEQRKSLYEKKTEDAANLRAMLEEIREAQELVNQKEEEYQKATRGGSEEALSNAYDEKVAAQKALEELAEKYYAAATEVGEYTSKNDELNNSLDVLTGKYDDSKEAFRKLIDAYKNNTITADEVREKLQPIRDAYNNGFIDMDEIEEKFGIAEEELFDLSDDLTMSAARGAKQGFNQASRELETVGVGYLKEVENKFDFFENEIYNKYSKKIGSIFDPVAEMWKNGLNPAISILDDVLSGITTALNSTFGQLNLLNKAAAESGGKSAYTVYSQLSTTHIPRLATGTYIPANYGEFLAVLGDNKREAEVVSPVSAMEQAMMNALYKSGMFGGSDDKEINLFIDGDKFFSWIVGKSNQYRKSHGNSPFQGVDI